MILSEAKLKLLAKVNFEFRKAKRLLKFSEIMNDSRYVPFYFLQCRLACPRTGSSTSINGYD